MTLFKNTYFKRLCHIPLIILFFISFHTLNTHAQDVTTPLDLNHPIYHHDISIFAGNYLGDEWRSTWDTGIQYSFFFSKYMGVGISYLYSPINVDTHSQFGQSITSKHTHTIIGKAVFANPCAFQAGQKQIHCKLIGSIGAGRMHINHTWQLSIEIGGGMLIYLSKPSTAKPHIALRFDVNTIIHRTPYPGNDHWNSDIVTNIGIAFLLP